MAGADTGTAGKAKSGAKPATGAKAKPGAKAKSSAGGTQAATRRPRRSAKSRAVEEVARSYFAAITARDPDAMAAHWDDEGIDDIVPVGILRGPDEVREFFRELFAASPDMELVVDRVIADDTVATVQWRSTGTFTGAAFQGIDPTGKRVELRGADCLEIEDGKIQRNTAYYDGAEFARAIGMLPARDSAGEKAMLTAFNAATKVRQVVGERLGPGRRA